MDSVSRPNASLDELKKELEALGVRGEWVCSTNQTNTVLNLKLVDNDNQTIFEFKGKSRQPWPGSLRDKQEKVLLFFAKAALNQNMKELVNG